LLIWIFQVGCCNPLSGDAVSRVATDAILERVTWCMILATFSLCSSRVRNGDLPFLLFFRSFREPAIYEEKLSDLGFLDINVQWIDLEMPFFLVTASKNS
jgi:hypothetical protein